MKRQANIFPTLFMDFRDQSVRMVQGYTRHHDLKFVIDSYGTLLLPYSFAEKMEPQQLKKNGRVLQDFLKKNKMKAKKVVVGMGQSGILTRNVNVPFMNEKDLASMMKMEVSRYLPVDLKEYTYDYHILEKRSEKEQEEWLLLLAAVKNQLLEQMIELLEEIRLKPMAIDVLPNIMHRLFSHFLYQDTLVLESNQDGTRITIFKGKTLFLYADVPCQVDMINETCDFTVLSKEVQGYLEYFSSRNFGKTIDKIIIVGEMASMPGIDYIFGREFSVPVIADLSVLGPLEFKGKGRAIANEAAVYASNIGLMLREKNLCLISRKVQRNDYSDRLPGHSLEA